MKKKALKKRLKDLELQRVFISDVLTMLRDTLEPKQGHYAMFALNIGMTAEGSDALDAFWQWADRQERSTLTRDQLLSEYEARVPPPLKPFLEVILKAHRLDGTKTFYCDLVLGEETPRESSA